MCSLSEGMSYAQSNDDVTFREVVIISKWKGGIVRNCKFRINNILNLDQEACDAVCNIMRTGKEQKIHVLATRPMSECKHAVY